MCVLAAAAKERDTGTMSPSGVRSRVPWGFLVCAVLVPASACTAVAGIGGFEVDPCFDGCDGGGGSGEGGMDAPGNETTTNPDATPDANPDGANEAGACDCPSGTHPVNGACVVTVVADASPPSVNCTTPLQLPDGCTMKAILHVCNGDPPFTVSQSSCIGDGGATRATGFLRLGNADAGTWKVTIKAAYSASRPNGSCTSGTAPCLADGTSVSNFTTTNSPNGDEIAVGKRDDLTPCQDIEIDVVPN